MGSTGVDPCLGGFRREDAPMRRHSSVLGVLSAWGELQADVLLGCWRPVSPKQSAFLPLCPKVAASE